ncbi:DUF5071 domain-containing protein [Paenibacillus sp. SYP-B3998]|uniref:DUF5071 domain-containing protein n=1 Tax=Paenibacillus sp. SYP-B3998 TaxID=2678564 RepID=A0A6G3ZYU3_9BACL|nr:DUF5071 domain-containing protein [Paenibacillus sp. SYP-B3998]NEW06864.1 DUF5071 domain-containing protein [Paenibacillus sp. SYP-B3998]
MDDLNQLLSYLRWDTSPDQLQFAKEQLKQLQDKELKLLVQPIDKMHWDNAAELLIEIGYPRVKYILSGLLEWIMDMNWPGASKISELLISIKEPLIPLVKEAFKTNDTIWQYWIIECILKNWSEDLVKQIDEELILLASGFDYEETHLSALKLLVQFEILDPEEILKLIDIKLQDTRNNDIFAELNELKIIVAR